MELNEKQYEAVVTTEGPVLLISGPGSGKTRTLVERAIHLLVEKKVKPENIFFSTFTEKSARELLVRISERIKEKNEKININEMYIGTLHSIFLRLIDENIEYSFFRDGYRVLDDIDQHFFIYSRIKRFSEIEGYREFFRDIPGINSWERSKKILEWLNKINEEGKRLDNIRTENRKILFLKEAHRVYHEMLVEENMMDFTTIQRELYRILHIEEVTKKLQKKIEYIMIDEYQDTNSIQEKIIFLLGEKRENICVVGDDDQGIYRFRGATVRNILRFPERFEKGRCKKINLDINYRSHRDIIRFCNKWINLINWREFRYEKEIVSPEDKEFPNSSGVIRIGGDSERQWKENIYRFIKKLHTTKKIADYSQIAFLFRSVQSPNVKELKKYLEESGIPIYSPRSKDFFERKEIKLVIGALLVYFPHCKYLVLDEVQNRGQSVFYYYKDCLALLKREVQNDEELYSWLVERRKENGSEDIGIIPSLRKIFFSLLQFKTFKNFIKLESESVKEGRETYNLGVFSEILEKFEALSKVENIPRDEIEKVVRYFFMVYMKNLYLKRVDEYESKEEFPLGAIPFLTFHQAKGLEFPIVIVGSLESTPMDREKTEEDILEELLRLGDDFEPRERKNLFDFWRIYYTAFSRAQNLLVLTSIENRSGRNELPSRTFRPIYEAIPYVDDEKFRLDRLEIESLKSKKSKELLSYTGHILLYEFCPLKYRFVKEFKFKTLSNPKTFYGIYVHKVVERVHREFLAGLFNIERVGELVESIGNSLEKSLRTEFSYEIRKRVYQDIVRYIEQNRLEDIVTAELKAYSVEKDYIIEGTLDLVRKSDEGIELIDFKTGKYDESRVDIYKRQLEIYTYLLRDKYSLDELKAYLYYIEELDSKIEVELDSQSIERSVKRFETVAERLLSGDFTSREYGESCEECEFKWYCMPKEKALEGEEDETKL